MFLSIFDVFKIGVGPSSSHTMGPMSAAVRFLAMLREHGGAPAPASIDVSLHGSLAFTGRGHATDRAVMLGLLGYLPADLDAAAEAALLRLAQEKMLRPAGLPALRFDPADDIRFDYGPPLPGHANGMIFIARDHAGTPVLAETFYSTGGGFIATAGELVADAGAPVHDVDRWPYPFETAASMLRMAEASGLSIASMKRANELVERDAPDLEGGIARIWGVMNDTIERGLARDGELPGGLRVRRRAKRLHEQLEAERRGNAVQPHVASDWLCAYAMAVNEENAAGGRVVTAPTNGAAGVIPAVLRYYRDRCAGASLDGIRCFVLTATAIGALFKMNASISGAEVGCQGEVGVACSMAAAGLCAALGGTNAQIENAAEIGMEHHLGMTCDPIGGLVQIPCIERNAFGAVKAITAASLALHGDGTHKVSLDHVVATMRRTGADMSAKYKETSQGGLAVNFIEC